MARAPSRALSRRHAAIRAAMAGRSLDALVLTSLPNILYLTNFPGTSAIVVLDRERLRFITDARYAAGVEAAQNTASACPGLQLVVTAGSYDASLAALVAEYAGRVGFEADHLSVGRHGWLSARLSRSDLGRGHASSSAADRSDVLPPDGARPVLVPTEGLVERERVIKDDYELDVLREAGRRLSGVASEVLSMSLRGRTEQQVAADIDWLLKRAGFERPAFDTIVAGGPAAALPHARPTQRIFSEGDLVVLDFGGVYDSYCVDLTRTVSLGPATTRARTVHRAVLEAQRRAIAAVAPGVSRFAVDAAARGVLAAAGMQEAFGHGTGHGLGIEIHEAPRIVQRRPDVDDRDEALDVGMVFTVEPGAYFPEWGGVRIEDDIVVTDRGADLLTDVTSDLVEL
jgi:Xaa-Pro aminopeptidase